jgi:hypothetical protein
MCQAAFWDCNTQLRETTYKENQLVLTPCFGGASPQSVGAIALSWGEMACHGDDGVSTAEHCHSPRIFEVETK